MPRIPVYQRQTELRGYQPATLQNTRPDLGAEYMERAADRFGDSVQNLVRSGVQLKLGLDDQARIENQKIEAAEVLAAKVELSRSLDEQSKGTIDPVTGIKKPGLMDREGKDAIGIQRDFEDHYNKESARIAAKLTNKQAQVAFQQFSLADKEARRQDYAAQEFSQMKKFQDNQQKALDFRSGNLAADGSISDALALAALDEAKKGFLAMNQGQSKEVLDAGIASRDSNFAAARLSGATDYASKQAAFAKYGKLLQGEQAVKAREMMKSYGVEQVAQDESDKLRNELGEDFTKGKGYAAIIAKSTVIKDSDQREAFIKQATLQWNQQNSVKRQQIADLGEQAVSISAKGGKVPDAIRQELLKTVEGVKMLEDAENVRFKLNKPDPQRIQQLNTMTPSQVSELTPAAAIAYRESLPPEQQTYFDSLQRQGARDKATIDGMMAKADGAAAAEAVKEAMQRRDQLRSNLYQLAGAKESSKATPEQSATQTRLAMQFDRMVSAIQAQKKGAPLTEADVNSAFLQFSSQVKNSRDGSTKRLYELMRDSWQETGDSMPITGAINRGDWVVHGSVGDFIQEAGVSPLELQQMAKNQGKTPEEYVQMRNSQALGFTSEEDFNNRRLVRTEEQVRKAAHNAEEFGDDKADIIKKIEAMSAPMLERTNLSENEIKQLNQMMAFRSEFEAFDWAGSSEDDIEEFVDTAKRRVNTGNFDPASFRKGSPTSGFGALWKYVTDSEYRKNPR